MPHSVICRSAAAKTLQPARAYFILHLLATTEQIQAGPGEQPGDGIEVGAEGFAANAGGLEGNGAAAAEASPTRGVWPKVRWPSCSTSSGRLVAVVPRWALISAQAAGRP